jgi:hypothetical protein
VRHFARRAKRLLKLQQQLLSAERLKLQTLQQAMAAAQKAESDAYSALDSGVPSQLPAELLLRMAASARARIGANQSALESQTERTLDQARKEALARRNLDAALANLADTEAKRALEAAIDAFLENGPADASPEPSMQNRTGVELREWE